MFRCFAINRQIYVQGIVLLILNLDVLLTWFNSGMYDQRWTLILYIFRFFINFVFFYIYFVRKIRGNHDDNLIRMRKREKREFNHNRYGCKGLR